jgi:hypothetical protein
MNTDVTRCIWCGYVIGVYEPHVVDHRGSFCTTSIAAEPHGSHDRGARYHRPCHLAARLRHLAVTNRDRDQRDL